MRKLVSSIGSTQPIDSTRPTAPRRGFGITRKVGNARFADAPQGLAVLERAQRRDLDAAVARSQVTFGIRPICSTNWVPLKLECRITTWNGSTRFS
jgi:hypothetical protein